MEAVLLFHRHNNTLKLVHLRTVKIKKRKCLGIYLRPVDWMAEFQRNASPVGYHVSHTHTHTHEREMAELEMII